MTPGENSPSIHDRRAGAGHNVDNLCDVVGVGPLLLAGAGNNVDEAAVVLNAALGTAGLLLLRVLLLLRSNTSNSKSVSAASASPAVRAPRPASSGGG